jgi:hypothetical protein
MMMVYYLGRAKGRAPGLDLQPQLVATFQAMKGRDVRPDARRCGEEMTALAKETHDLAATFTELAKTEAK